MEQQGLNILLSIVKSHIKLNVQLIHFFCFEKQPSRIQKFVSSNNIKFYDFTSNILNGKFLQILEDKQLSGIVIIDSLAQVITEYEINACYKALHNLVSSGKFYMLWSKLHIFNL